ncbi:22963_t:CDS:2 [Gigaspora margarita]|uniref:22963_t:CDS:1 n=1 Tax=Gigaspora margarita TaxID=4874 RepID=A0ABN7V519_GIGMA|nr:22963_t:CDS:2 [Gigaspora margarita]
MHLDDISLLNSATLSLGVQYNNLDLVVISYHSKYWLLAEACSS